MNNLIGKFMKKLLTSTMMLATFALAGCATTDVNSNAGTAIGTANEIDM